MERLAAVRAGAGCELFVIDAERVVHGAEKTSHGVGRDRDSGLLRPARSSGASGESTAGR